MSEFKIEKGIPLAPKRRPSKSTKYPWAEMEVGDSFFVPAEANVTRRALSDRVQRSAAYAKKTLGRKFKLRSDETGVRIWRTE